ncbi:transcriptional regulator, partial [Bacillus toyonensis]
MNCNNKVMHILENLRPCFQGLGDHTRQQIVS